MNTQYSFPKIPTKTIATSVSKAAERSIKQGHPWVYKTSIIKLKQEGSAGDLSVIFDHKSNKLLAIGLYDPNSNIAIKIISVRERVILDQGFFSTRISNAFENRKPLFQITNAYRLIHGENDFLPGLIIDHYNQVAVIKLYSSMWFPYLEFISNAIKEITSATTQVLRFSRQVEALKVKHGYTEGQVIYGELKQQEILINENNVHFKINVIHGHKTGFFLDHRQNRILVGELSEGKHVLDVFCYAGGFSTHALSKGAKSCVSIDISGQAINAAKHNVNLNEIKGIHKPMVGHAFNLLQSLILSNKKFDLIVIDPPSFAKSRDEIPRALKQYERLAWLASQLITQDGMIFLASCSSKITEADFLRANENGLNKSNLRYFLKMKNSHDIDHPIEMSESVYLKCCVYQMS